MRCILTVLGYNIYITSKDTDYVNVHISKYSFGTGTTKVFVLSDGRTILKHNKSKIPKVVLDYILQYIASNPRLITKYWYTLNNSINYKD